MKAKVKFQLYRVVNETNGLATKVWYDFDNHVNGKRCVTIHDREYSHKLGVIFKDAGVEYRNETDFQTDYFDKGRVDIFEGHEDYLEIREQVQKLHERLKAKQKIRENKRIEKKLAKVAELATHPAKQPRCAAPAPKGWDKIEGDFPYLVLFGDKFLGHGRELVREYPDAELFATAYRAERMAKEAGIKNGLKLYQVVTVEDYQAGNVKTPVVRAFNTGRLYTAAGQRIAYTVLESGRVAMYDLDRMIDQVLVFPKGFDPDNADVLRAYDTMAYAKYAEAKEDLELARELQPWLIDAARKVAEVTK